MKKIIALLLVCFILSANNVFAAESSLTYRGVVDGIIADGGMYNYDQNNGRWKGLIYGELIDFDNNGSDEMLVVYRGTGDDALAFGTVAVYGNNNGIAEKLYEEKIGGYLGQTDSGYFIAIKEINGRKYLYLNRYNDVYYDDKGTETISIFSVNDGKSETVNYYGETGAWWDSYTFDYTLCKRNEEVISESEYLTEINGYLDNAEKIDLVYSTSESGVPGRVAATKNRLETFVNTIKSNYDESSAAKEEKYPSTDTVCNLYYDVIRNNPSMLSEYSIYDIEKDGIPELLLKTGEGEAEYEYCVYTVAGNELKQIGKFSGFHSSLFSYRGNGVLSHVGYMGYELVSLVSFENGTLTQAAKFEADDSYDANTGNYMYYSNMDKYFEGAKPIRDIYEDKSYDTLVGEVEQYLVHDSDIKVLLNNKQLTFDQAPVLLNNRTLVPMRKIFETLGAEVTWNREDNSAVSTNGDITVTIKINSNTILINDKKVETDVAPMIIGDRTLVPVRAISEAFRVSVDWNEDLNTVSLFTN